MSHFHLLHRNQLITIAVFFSHLYSRIILRKDQFQKFQIADSKGSHKKIIFELNKDNFPHNYRSFSICFDLVWKSFEKILIFMKEGGWQIIHTATAIGKKWPKNCLEMHAA